MCAKTQLQNVHIRFVCVRLLVSVNNDWEVKSTRCCVNYLT